MGNLILPYGAIALFVFDVGAVAGNAGFNIISVFVSLAVVGVILVSLRFHESASEALQVQVEEYIAAVGALFLILIGGVIFGVAI